MLIRIAVALVAIVTLALVGGSLLMGLMSGSDDRFAQCREGEVAGGLGAIGGPFTLVDGSGATVTDADVITEPSLVYFGYTFCPDVCPLDTARNALAVDLLAERGLDAQPVFISVDPARDTPEVVAAYAENFHDDMIGLTGDADQVRAASQAYRTYYSAGATPEEDPYYLVDHSTFTYLVLPDAGVVEFFRRSTPAEEVADRTACFIAAS